MVEWEYVLGDIVQIVARIVITALVPYAVKLLKDKIHNDKVNKYIDKAQDVVIQCVDYVNQTYVDGLKAEGKFDKDAQAVAFSRSREYVLRMLDSNAREAVVEIFGDLELWIDSMIESSVRNSINHALALPVIDEGVVMEDDN